jgi:hypothetical protein
MNMDLTFNSIPNQICRLKTRFESPVRFFISHSDVLKDRDLYFNVLVKMAVEDLVFLLKKNNYLTIE